MTMKSKSQLRRLSVQAKELRRSRTADADDAGPWLKLTCSICDEPFAVGNPVHFFEGIPGQWCEGCDCITHLDHEA